jgi:pimeloyl-ACP methyl ester carboxylesterase
MATMDTTRIQSLILMGSTSYFPEESRDKLRQLTYENVSANRPGWMEYMKSVHPRGENQIRWILNNYVLSADSYDDMNFTAPYLSTINCSTLIIHGDRDPYFSINIPVNSYMAIPKSYLWIIPNFEHSTPKKDSALGALFTETIIKFLAGNWKD